MDAFTQRMLERAQARREKLDKQLNSVGEQTSSKKRVPLLESNQPAVESSVTVFSSQCSSPSPVKGKAALSRKVSTASPKRLSQGGRRFSKSPRKEATPPPPARPVSDDETEDDDRGMESDSGSERDSCPSNSQKPRQTSGGESGAAITDGVRSRLKRMGALYSDAEQLSSPIHRTEGSFSAEPVASKTRNKSATRSARLAALASTINQWEDDLSHPSVATAAAREKAPVSKPVSRLNAGGRKRKSIGKNEQQPATCSTEKGSQSPNKFAPSSRLPGIKVSRKSGECSPKGNILAEVTSSPTKALQWDKAMLDSLESQGFTRSSSNNRLIYDYEEETQDTSVDTEASEDNQDENAGRSPLRGSPLRGSPLRGSPVKNFNKFTSPSRSPMVMGVAQLRSAASPIRQSPGSPSVGASSPVKSQFKFNLKPVSIDDSQPEGSVLQRAAKYESEATSPTKRMRDPAELPLSERMALFEKNKGPLLVPKVPFSTPMPAKLLKESEPTAQPARKSPKKPTAACPPIKEPVLPKSPSKVASTMKQNIEESAVLRRLQLFEAGRIGLEESPSRPQNQAVAERRKEMEMLSSRWNRNKEMAVDEPSSPAPKSQATPLKASHNVVPGTPPPPPPMPGSPLATAATPPRRSPRRPISQDVYPGASDVKRIKVSPPKPGRLYPSLSDVEATTETEDHSSADHSYEDEESSLDLDSTNNSFGKDILEAAEKVHSSYRSQKDSKDDVSITESAVLRDMDDFLEEALDESSDEEQKPSPPKKTRTTPSKKSDSFHYKEMVKETVPEPVLERRSPRRASTKYRAPQPPSTPSTASSTEEQQMPLMHTVSFYRKQQNMTPRTPAKQVQTQGSPEKLQPKAEERNEQERHLVEVRVRNLLDEVSKQQTVISQASQALNLCNATVEFSGSSEQVEGERLLLLSTHKRQAALNEIQRLKVEGTLRPQNPSGYDLSNFSEHGTLHISNITLPVKRDFVRSISAEDNSHHFVCLAKCQDVILATSVLSIANTRDLQGGQTLRFTSSLTLADLYSNFRVTLEIYTMTCRKEVLPHDIKYHINKKDVSKHRMTPKKQKQESHLLRPPVQSPAGPGAVRSPQFSLIGYVIFSLREIQRTSFTLNKVPYTSPLEGSIQLSLKCDLSLDIEHRGFLTMYEVVSGYGAWHRRWCLLKGEMLSYWKYPDHEKKEIPIGSIDLRSCVTENVGLVSRDLCARLNTFLLETSRPAKPTDENSLDLICMGDVTHVRHLLSADTREERLDWCTQINKALAVIRAWGKKTDL
ncbi:LOW QUALITY PROTEIN: anillin-like [Thrips palmi]|uniref:LOW QUALITY PROTEIN: anillin-like n=1 Tax=Thrips palmi TaxID=161013 RepID=A0A6P8ZGL2_THRPL|nr:LOW QUALITY PROTEIN: anillin-like [Thrips palmi]